MSNKNEEIRIEVTCDCGKENCEIIQELYGTTAQSSDKIDLTKSKITENLENLKLKYDVKLLTESPKIPNSKKLNLNLNQNQENTIYQELSDVAIAKSQLDNYKNCTPQKILVNPEQSYLSTNDNYQRDLIRTPSTPRLETPKLVYNYSQKCTCDLRESEIPDINEVRDYNERCEEIKENCSPKHRRSFLATTPRIMKKLKRISSLSLPEFISSRFRRRKYCLIIN